MTLNEHIEDEFPSPTYDVNFINDVVSNYNFEIDHDGDLLNDNLDLFFHIWESFESIGHPNMKSQTPLEAE